MSDTLAKVQDLIRRGAFLISDHGYDELAADEIYAHDVVSGVASAEVIEDYPDARHGPSVLVLQFHEGRYAAEVPVTLIEDDSGWSPYLSPDDVYKLDAVRIAL